MLRLRCDTRVLFLQVTSTRATEEAEENRVTSESHRAHRGRRVMLAYTCVPRLC